jgi:hypothetical protein
MKIWLEATQGGVYYNWVYDDTVIIFYNTTFKFVNLTSNNTKNGGFVRIVGEPTELLFQNSTFAFGKVFFFLCV